jgi:hypothetical protein
MREGIDAAEVGPALRTVGIGPLSRVAEQLADRQAKHTRQIFELIDVDIVRAAGQEGVERCPIVIVEQWRRRLPSTGRAAAGSPPPRRDGIRSRRGALMDLRHITTGCGLGLIAELGPGIH